MAVCFDPCDADSFELDYFDQYFHLILWLKVNNDTVFEASVLEYDRYESMYKVIIMSQVPRIVTGPKNQHFLCKPRAV